MQIISKTGMSFSCNSRGSGASPSASIDMRRVELFWSSPPDLSPVRDEDSEHKLYPECYCITQLTCYNIVLQKNNTRFDVWELIGNIFEE